MYRGYGMMGLLPSFLARRPHVAEHDFTGVVVDANGTELQEGQEVYGWIPLRTSFPFPPPAFILTFACDSHQNFQQTRFAL